jgi:nucleoside-diphosphate kinase
VERTFVMIKPDAVQRGLVGEIVARFERKGLDVTALVRCQLTREQAEANYAEHLGKPFYESLVAYVTSGPVVMMILEGEKAVSVARTLIGATDPAEAAPGTIRGDLGLTLDSNIVHGSDSAESAAREIALFFG